MPQSSPDMTLFQGLTAIVTGAAGGIGAALAERLVALGARVAVADINLSAVEAVATRLGEGARAYPCDVTDRASVLAFAEGVARDYGEANLVFANAGIFLNGPLADATGDEIDWLFDVNVKGVVHTIQAFLPLVLAQGAKGRPARFILTGSENSVGLPFVGVNTLYTASKHAILGIGDGLRRDLKDSGVGVSVLCPGAVNTRLWDSGANRPDAYGGKSDAEPAFAERARKAFATYGQAPARTAEICLQGVADDQFVIIADPAIRGIAEKRAADVEAGLVRIEG